MPIFREFAPLYWGAGIPAMPLKFQSKVPILSEWTSYGKVMPTTAIQNHWLNSYPNNNIGLPFGPASGLAAIDIDTIDEAQVEAIMDCLPASPWTRIGKKGCGLIYRWSGQKNFKVRGEEGMLCEFLGLGNQMVLPPSIHPDTLEAYTSNTNLWEVMDKIQPLPDDIEARLREALGVKGFSLVHEGRSSPLRVVPAGERDIMLVRQAGYFARIVLGIDKREQFPLSDAMKQMHQWVSEYTAGAAGDDMDPDKGVAKLLEFLLRDIEKGRTMPIGWDADLSSEQREHPSIVALIAAQTDQKWTLTRAKAFFEDRIILNPTDCDWAQDCAKETIRRVSSDSEFGDYEFDPVAAYLKLRLSELGASMSKSALTKLFKEGRMDDSAGITDHHAAALFMVAHITAAGQLRYCSGHFSQWTGSHFVRLSDESICDSIGDKMKENPLVRRHNDYVAVTKSMQNHLQEQVVEDPHAGINFNNGFLDTNAVLHDHAPCFGQTYVLPFDYDADLDAPPEKLLNVLEGAWGGDADYEHKVAALQEVLGAIMFNVATDYQRAFLFFGTSGSSKSVIQQTFVGMLPREAVTSLSPSVWGERFQTAQLVDVALNVCAELPELGKINGAVFKEIVDGSIQMAEFKGKTGVPFKPRAAHLFASNHLPTTRDSSSAFVRRWLFLLFTRAVPLQERIPNYHIAILEERKAIARWAVAGYLRLKEQKMYTLPASHVELSTKVLMFNNSVAAFFEKSLVVTTTQDAEPCSAIDLFMYYKAFMQSTSAGSAGSFEQFTEKLRDLGYKMSDVMNLDGNAVQTVSGVLIRPTLALPGLRTIGR